MMQAFLHSKKTYILVVALLVLVVANVWIFLPRFAFNNQMLTAEKLDQDQAQLQELAGQAATLLSTVNGKSVTSEDVDQELESITHQVDTLVLVLREGQHQAEINQRVERTLEAADILSFTLHNYQSKLNVDQITSLRTSMIVRQSVKSEVLAGDQ